MKAARQRRKNERPDAAPKTKPGAESFSLYCPACEDLQPHRAAGRWLVAICDVCGETKEHKIHEFERDLDAGEKPQF